METEVVLVFVGTALCVLSCLLSAAALIVSWYMARKTEAVLVACETGLKILVEGLDAQDQVNRAVKARFDQMQKKFTELSRRKEAN